MKKILFVTNIPSPYSADLFYYLQSSIKKYKFYVLYTHETEDNRKWTIDKEKLKNTIILKSRILKVKTKLDIRYIHIPGKVFNTISRVNPDMVIAWEYNIAAVQSMIWCKRHNKKFISVTEGTLLTESNLWLIQKITRKMILSTANAFLVSGIKAKEKLLSWGVKKEKIFTELLTVDVNNFVGGHREVKKNIILYVGSLVKRKGVDLLISALPLIENNYVLRIVGNGTEDEISTLKKIADSLNVSDKIEWCGFKEGKDLVKEYKEAAVFVLPTREDCFGLVLLEALASGVPIVASKYADGAYDIVLPGKNGLMVDPYKKEELAEAIDFVLGNPKIWPEWEQYSAEIVKKFSYPEVSKGIIDAIEFGFKKTER